MRKVGGSIYIKWITICNEDRSKVGVRIFSPFSGGWMDPDVFLIRSETSRIGSGQDGQAEGDLRA